MVDSKFFHIFLSLKFDKPLNQLLLYDKCFIRGPEKLQLVRLRIELYYLRERSPWPSRGLHAFRRGCPLGIINSDYVLSS